MSVMQKMKGSRFLGPAIAGGAGLLLVVVFLANLLVDVPPGHVGILEKKWGTSLEPGMVVAPDSSYQGVQKDILPTGWHIVFPVLERVDVQPAVEIPPGRVGIVTRRVGETPEVADDILVEKGERGYQRDVLNPGTYFLNPYVEEVEVVDAVRVPAGSVGLVTAKTGLRSDKDLVDEGERGVQRNVLRPGTYYMNTRGYDVTIHPAVEIEAGFVGVVVLKTGPDPQVANAIVVARDERGVQPYTLPAGLHYLNPYEYEVIQVDSRTQKYEMTEADTTLSEGEVSGDDRLSFPSADGFTIKVDTSIEWQIETDNIPEVVTAIGNTDEIVRKIIRPNAREIGRLEGSKLKAEDFIKGDKRELFVVSFSETLKQRCAEKGIKIHKALVRAVFPPEEIARPLKEREVAILQRVTNEEKRLEAVSEASLAEEKEKIEQKRAMIKADTEKEVAQTNAEREKEVAKIKAEQLKEVAAIERDQQSLILEKQKLEAQGITEIAEAEAYKARAIMQADGALDRKLQAWSDVMRVFASNPNLVPRVVVGGGGEGKSGLTGQELIIDLMAIERLDRLAQSGEYETPLVKPGSKAKAPSSSKRAPR